MVTDEKLEGQRPATARLDSVERDGLDYPLYQQSSAPPDAIGMDPEDGMPKQIPSTAVEDSRAPALRVATFVCMADTSKFVIRDRWGEVEQEFAPDEVGRAPDGRYRVAERKAHEVHRCLSELGFIEVEPIRPQCKHYVRQLVPWPDNPDVKRCQRYCSALKNEQGELLSLADQEILACEIRDPRTEDDEQIDAFDQLIIARGAEAEGETEFDIDAELQKESGNLGILGG